MDCSDPTLIVSSIGIIPDEELLELLDEELLDTLSMPPLLELEVRNGLLVPVSPDSLLLEQPAASAMTAVITNNLMLYIGVTQVLVFSTSLFPLTLLVCEPSMPTTPRWFFVRES